MKRLALLAATLAFASRPAHAADTMDPALKEKARRSIDAGLHYLRGQQAENGSLSGSVGITALALRAFLESHRGYNEADGPFVTRQVEFILSKVNDDGSISESLQNRSYNTAVALVALAATKNPKYAGRDRQRPEIPERPPDRRERRLQAGPPLLRRHRLRRRRASRHVEPVPRDRGPEGHCRPIPRTRCGRRRWCS